MNKKLILITEGSFKDLSVAQNTNRLLKIVKNFFNDIYVITYCDKNLINLENDRVYNLKTIKSPIKSSIFKQIQITSFIYKIYKKKNVKTVMFAFGMDMAFIPLIFAKSLGFNIILRSDARTSVTAKYTVQNYEILKYLMRTVENMDYRLADLLLTETECLVERYDLNDFDFQVGNLFVDLELFKKFRNIKDRKYDIGFFGRLEIQKQPLNFIKSLGMIDIDLDVLMIGYGSQKEDVMNYIDEIKDKTNITIKQLDWINNEDLPNYLNEIKLLAAPSLWEGLPNTIMEAMACGCIVLSTDVGGIKDIITDRTNGFLLNETDPDCIANTITEIFTDYEFEEISNNATKSIKDSFSYENTLENWRKLF